MDFLTQWVVYMSFIFPAMAAAAMLPLTDDRYPILRARTWAFGTVAWYLGLALASITPTRWGWAIVWGSMALGILLILSWVAAYRAGRNR